MEINCSCKNNNDQINNKNNEISIEKSIGNLKEWLSNYSYGLVDLRNRNQYENRHFPNSSNIPLKEFEERMFELPPRQSNIGIVYNEEGEEEEDFQINTIITIKRDDGTIEKEIKIKTIKELILYKLTNYSIKFLLTQKELEINEKELYENQFIEKGNNSKMLWKPCLYISENIDTVESKLKEIYKINNSNNENNVKFNAIDIACGSGRDCLFLANRNCWNVVGVDNDEILLNKMTIASKRFNIENDVKPLLLELEPSVPKESLENNTSNQSLEENQCYQLLPILLKPINSNNINNNNDNIHQGYDLVHVARYLHRPLFKLLRDLIKPGGFIIYHTFMVPGTKPKRPRFLLNPNELKERFNGFNILDYKETNLDDGRPIQVIFAQKPLN